MRGATVASSSDEGPRSQSPASVPGARSRWRGFRGVDRAIVLAQVSDVLTAGAAALAPAELLTAVCEAMASYYSLTNAVFFKRLAGQARTLVWSAPGVSAAGRMAAREQAWTSAAELVDDGASPGGEGTLTTSASVRNDRLALSAMFYIESSRTLDGQDQSFLEELLRRMLCLPAHEQ